MTQVAKPRRRAARSATTGSASAWRGPSRGRGSRSSAASNHIYAQVIDDSSGRTAGSRLDAREGALASSGTTKTEEAAVVGRLVAERAKAAGVEHVVFDRAGFRYHGRIKSLADAAREAGLDF